ncbi:cobalt-precorrin-5B (C(1))-methyltransferase CbiD [Deinococcus deserti]|uniref:Cobalt-precorrin-5B C(1)-methyltransferase n=1 Tax=Deinococcus deserti (strain DSM 17065 / CIP 109153 / LMG 22923 / VCD115) TaxID=546414 RepID=C1D341_DEIDV|nr:cobalt-precorrin-5B (C(1))-methyltransferase CbiD [Deinococcus deserti]ACO47830.1 putative cobalamin biosynthesis protein CbiD [Deinococcus deserti VCD115]
MPARPLLDLSQPAPNGLRRGFTTGSAATAALKAALTLLYRGEVPSPVEITLPDGDLGLRIPVQRVELTDAGAYGEVIKDGGDDPDATHGAALWVRVTPLAGAGPSTAMTFHAGEGVGTVTAPGIRVPVGEPAINPVPRDMMRRAAHEVAGHEAFAVTVGCVNGEKIARRTFNPRLGIVGGISILGTTGVVEPMSLEAYAASVEVEVRVAAHARPAAVVFTPGKLGRDYAEQTLGIQREKIVQISNFVGAGVDALQEALTELPYALPLLLVAGHPGKLAKVLNGDWNTHSSHSGMAMNALARVAAEVNLDPAMVDALAGANTVDACVELLAPHPQGAAVWSETARQIARTIQNRAPAAERVQVALFALDGTPLGEARTGGGA